MPGIAIWVWVLVCAAYDKYIPQLLFLWPQTQTNEKECKEKCKNKNCTLFRSSRLHRVSRWNTERMCLAPNWALSTVILIFIVFLFLYHSVIKSRTLMLFTQFTSKMESSISVIPSVSFGRCNTNKAKCKHELPYWSINTEKNKQEKYVLSVKEY